MKQRSFWLGLIACVFCALLCGCQSFLYPLITDKNALEDPRIEGKHQWMANGEAYEAIITKVKQGAYKALVTSPEGKTELLVKLTKIKDQTFFQLSAFPQEFTKKVDEQTGEGMNWATLITLTQRPNYVIGKIVSFEPHLRITFFNASAAAEKYFSGDLSGSYHSYPTESSGDISQKVGALIVVPPDKLRAFIERACNDPACFTDSGFAE